MKRKNLKVISFFLCGVMLLTALAGCSTPEESPVTEPTPTPVTEPTSTAEPTPETVTITDGFGREVTVTKPIRTVASGISMVSELMVSLGLKDRIAGIDRSTATSDFIFQDLLSLPSIQTAEDNHYNVDFEKIIALDPDVFITGVIPQEGFDTIVDTLEPEIPCIALSYDTPEETAESVALLGELFDCQEAADDYIEFFNGTIDMIAERTADIREEDKPKVYYEWMPYYTFNKDLYMYQVQIDIAGGVNIAADMATTYGLIDPEWIIEKDPDIILAMAMDYSYMGYDAVECGYKVDDYSSMRAYRESVMNRSEISDVTAAREGQVYVFHYNLSATACVGYAYMAKWLHPDLFEDLDPQALHQEWLTRFIGLDYDLDEHGVFVYPEP
jgi:iron complex transport system substrate-binding protein